MGRLEMWANGVMLSVVIPTYNRKGSLLRLLYSLAEQTEPPTHFEVIVADDGSSDGTGEAVRALTLPYEIHYSWAGNAGVNAARNRGLDKASGPIVLFLDDDMVADAQLVEEHIAAHEAHRRAVVKGQVILAAPPDARLDMFASLQIGRPDIEGILGAGIQPISYQRIGAGHFSIPRDEALAIGRWDESLTGYGFRDLEFMYRGHTHGLHMLYNPSAITYHHDYAISFPKYCRRIRRASATAARDLFHKHPGLRGQIPMFRDKGYVAWGQDMPALILRKLLRGLTAQRPILRGLESLVLLVERTWPSPRLLAPLYRWVTGAYICQGYREGLRSVAEAKASHAK